MFAKSLRGEERTAAVGLVYPIPFIDTYVRKELMRLHAGIIDDCVNMSIEQIDALRDFGVGL